MPGNNILQHLRHFLHVNTIFIKLHHGVEVIHGGIRGIELVINHVELLCRERMLCCPGFLLFHCGRNSIVLFQALQIERCNLFRRTPAEDDPGIQPFQRALADKIDRAKRVTPQFVKIIVNTDLG